MSFVSSGNHALHLEPLMSVPMPQRITPPTKRSVLYETFDPPPRAVESKPLPAEPSPLEPPPPEPLPPPQELANPSFLTRFGNLLACECGR